MAKRQLGRRNIPDIVRIQLVQVLKPEIQRRAREHERAGGKRSGKGLPNLANPIDTRKELARAAGVSPEQYRKGAYILGYADEETIQKVRSKKQSIHAAYQETSGNAKPRTVSENFLRCSNRLETIISISGARQNGPETKQLMVYTLKRMLSGLEGK